MAFVLTVVAAIPVSATSSVPELRWIAYVRANRPSDIADQAGVNLVRSDGRGHQASSRGRFLSADLGPGGVLHAVPENEADEGKPPSNSMVTAWINEGRSEEWGGSDAYYFAVAASSDGRVAVARQVTTSQQIPFFLTEGIETLRTTSVPVLVPPEEPPGTGGLVPSAEEDSYQLLFTNDPAGELAHVEQINVFVSGLSGEPHPIPDPQSMPVTVRGTDGEFFCGASTCFLSWNELGTNYTVGEFGASEEALAFAESLLSIDTVAGPGWREGAGQDITAPELVLRDNSANERLLESVDGFCECAYRPLDWSTPNDRILVLAGADGHTTLREYRAEETAEPTTLAEGVPDADGGLILDAAYGLEGVVALFAGKRGPPGTLRQLDAGNVLASGVRAFDIEGSTLAYVNEAREVIVRDLDTGNERTVGEGAIDVSVAPDLISDNPGRRPRDPGRDGRLGILPVVFIAVTGLAFLAGAALIFVRRRRGLD